MGSSLRQTVIHAAPTPGPGTYTVPSVIGETSKWGFGSNKRDSSRLNKSPGPGAYEITPRRDPRAFSLVARRTLSLEKTKEVPGPGTYSPMRTYDSLRFSVSKSIRQPLSFQTAGPGPGAYFSVTESPRRGNACNLSKGLGAPSASDSQSAVKLQAQAHTTHRQCATLLHSA